MRNRLRNMLAVGYLLAVGAALFVVADAAASENCKSWPKFPQDSHWCRVENHEGYGLWRTETKITGVTVQDDPLSPVFVIRLANHLCDACENRHDRIVYVSRRIAPDQDDISLLNALTVHHMVDSAKMALALDRTVRIVVRTDLTGKRNLNGKFRDPVVRIAVLDR